MLPVRLAVPALGASTTSCGMSTCAPPALRRIKYRAAFSYPTGGAPFSNGTSHDRPPPIVVGPPAEQHARHAVSSADACGSHASGAQLQEAVLTKRRDPEEARVVQHALVGGGCEGAVQADEHRDGGQRGQASRQRIHPCVAVQTRGLQLQLLLVVLERGGVNTQGRSDEPGGAEAHVRSWRA
eukprot:scaffold260_cov328-Prasinococcus_capsulatus_cf.AAC.1